MPPPEDHASDTELAALVRRRLDTLGHRDDADVARLLAAIHRRHGERVAAVLLYGSYLRGKRDTLLDFYVLLTDLRGALPRLQAWGNRWLPPNVYHLALPEAAGGPALRAKYATLTTAQFQRAMSGFDAYFWSRFTQPAGLVEARDEESARRVSDAVAGAVGRFVREVAPMLEGDFSPAEFWRCGLSLTYACELRSEDPAGVAALYGHHARHLDALLAAHAAAPGAVIARRPDGRYAAVAHGGRRRAPARWAARRVLGKVLSVLRLVKAAGTFDDPLDYLLWKIERHSGMTIAPSERQRRHPLIFAWPLLWRLYRRGAFR
jgi:hypothetical protein